MTLISQIIADAYREGNLVAIGVSPTANETTEALRLLNRLVPSLFGNEFGNPLTPLAFGTNGIETPNELTFTMDDLLERYVPADTRLQCNLSEAKTVSLPPSPRDGDRFSVVDNSGNFSTHNLTVNGNGRLIEGAASVVLSTDDLQKDWFYRDDTGNWAPLSPLIVTDESPFPEEFDDMLILGLYLRLIPRNGVAFTGETQAAYSQVRKKFAARYNHPKQVTSEVGMLNLRESRYYSGTTQSFLRGRP